MSISSLNGRWQALFKLALAFGPIACAAGIAAQGWMLARLARIDERMATMTERITAVEVNRFSNKDGQEIWSAIADMRAQLARIPAELPPAWFAEKVEKIGNKVDQLAIEMAMTRRR